MTALMFAVIPAAANAQSDSYTLDPYHTFANFTVDHLGLSTMYGRFGKNSGKFAIERAAKTATLEVVTETASVDTGDQDKGSRPRSRNDHPRTAECLNV